LVHEVQEDKSVSYQENREVVEINLLREVQKYKSVSYQENRR
jgi:hypothetical protein